MSNNIIDKIQLSGVTYDIGGQGGSGVSVVEVTQAVYDALPSSAKTDTSKMYVITDAEAGDLTNYYTKTQTNTLLGGKADTATTYTKTEVDNAITAATSTKQDTLVSGTNIKTINSQSLLGSGNIVIQGGSGGGKAIEAGRGISITTGETADTVSFNLPISAGTGTNSVIFGNSNNKANGQYSHAEGANTTASGNYSHAEGLYTKASGSSSHAEGGATTASGESSHAEGFSTNASGNYSHAEGYSTLASGGNGSHAEGYQTSATSLSSHAEGGYNSTSNSCEHASGRYNITTSASTTFGDSGNTLFSVGNGTSSSARHNAFEIRQNGDIYISSGGTDIKLQDHLGGGGGSYTPGDGIDITNNIISVTGKVDTTTYNAYTAATDTALASKQTTLTAGTNISIIDNVISATGGGGGGGITSSEVQSMIDESISGKADTSSLATVATSGSYNDLDNKPTIPTVPTSNTAFTNDAQYATSGYVDSAVSGKANSSDVYLKSETSGATELATALSGKQATLVSSENIKTINNESILGSGNITIQGGGGEVSSAITSGDTNAVAGGAVFDAVVYSGNTYNTELTFNADGYAENWVVRQSAITIDVSGYTSNTTADYHFENSDGRDLGYAHIHKNITSFWTIWYNNENNCTITTDGDTATTATITDIPSGTVKVRRTSEDNPPKAIISGDTQDTWIKDALDEHRDNTTIHITAAERTSWNNKSNFSGSYNDLTDKPIPDSALNVVSRNPVQNQALFSELRIDGEGEAETTLVFDGNDSTNYPNGCTKIKVEDIASMSMNTIYFKASEGPTVGIISVYNFGGISVETGNFQGATYEISGSTVIISYPTVTTVDRLNVGGDTKYTYKAITSSTTPLKDQVIANTTALGGLSLVKLTQTEYDNLQTKDSNTLYVIVN